MKVAIIGAGLIGSRRAEKAVEQNDEVVAVYDIDQAAAASLAGKFQATPTPTAAEAIEAADIVVVATYNDALFEYTKLAVETKKHVLVEKPMGRNRAEAKKFSDLQDDNPSLVIKTGFNHRYHPAISEAHKLVSEGSIGNIYFIRAVYGHGARRGYEKEWRRKKTLSGGGELIDQGVHLIDLIRWFVGRTPEWTFAQKRTYLWSPESLEDNSFFILGWGNSPKGIIAQVHASCTQWKNRFSLEIYGENGAVDVNGLTGSYGEEKLTVYVRKPIGGKPLEEIRVQNKEDSSWIEEWKDFRRAIDKQIQPEVGGTTEDNLAVMTTLDAIYKSCKDNVRVDIIS